MPKVKPIPKGYHSVTPGLSVSNADALIKFCKKAFGAKELLRMKGPGGSLMHAEIEIGNSRIMLGDENPAWGTKSAKTLGGTPVSLYIYTDNCDAMFKKAVGAGAAVKMPPTDMFWGDRYGQVEDPFGNLWGIATHVKDVDPKEMKKGAAAMVKAMSAGACAAGWRTFSTGVSYNLSRGPQSFFPIRDRAYRRRREGAIAAHTDYRHPHSSVRYGAPSRRALAAEGKRKAVQTGAS
jgi:uncharacterized glyoxalase superfamily protein PhnB